MKTLPLFLSLCFLALTGCETFRSGPIMPPITAVEVNDSPRAEHRVIDTPETLAAFRQEVDRLPGSWVPTMVEPAAILASAYLKAGDKVIGEVYFGATWIGLQIPPVVAAPGVAGVTMQVKQVSKPDWITLLVRLQM